MIIYEIEQGKIHIYTNLDPEKATPRELAADYSKINKILEKIKPEIHVVMLPEYKKEK